MFDIRVTSKRAIKRQELHDLARSLNFRESEKEEDDGTPEDLANITQPDSEYLETRENIATQTDGYSNSLYHVQDKGTNKFMPGVYFSGHVRYG